MPQLPLYEDSLVVLTSVSLLLKRYYFPTLKPKLVSLPKVQRIEILYPNLWTGRFHLWSSGDLRTFHPLDFGWPKRDRIFGRHNGTNAFESVSQSKTLSSLSLRSACCRFLSPKSLACSVKTDCTACLEANPAGKTDQDRAGSFFCRHQKGIGRGSPQIPSPSARCGWQDDTVFQPQPPLG